MIDRLEKDKKHLLLTPSRLLDSSRLNGALSGKAFELIAAALVSQLGKA